VSRPNVFVSDERADCIITPIPAANAAVDVPLTNCRRDMRGLEDAGGLSRVKRIDEAPLK